MRDYHTYLFIISCAIVLSLQFLIQLIPYLQGLFANQDKWQILLLTIQLILT